MLEEFFADIKHFFTGKEVLRKEKVGDNLWIFGNKPRTECYYDKKPLELIFPTLEGRRGQYICQSCKTIYDLPVN